MSISPEQVRRIAALAGLEPGDDEVDRLAGELSDILAHFERLRGAAGAEPLPAEGAERAEETAEAAEAAEAEAADAAEPGRRARLRPDEPGADRLEADPAAMAPGWRGGFFTVPRLASHEAAADPAESGDSGDSGEGRR